MTDEAAHSGTLDVLLISPHQAYRQDGSPHSGDADMAWTVPLGVLSIAQYLHDQGIAVRLLHLPSVEPDDSGGWRLEQILAQHPARVVGIQCHWQLYSNGALQVAEAYRRGHPGAQIVVGGSFAAALAEPILAACPALDAVIEGEGEGPMLQLARAARAGEPCAELEGSWLRDDQGAVRYRPASPASLLPIEALPPVDPAAAPFAEIGWVERAYVNIARGRCPVGCAFCAASHQRSFYCRSLAMMPPQQVIEQLRLYEQLGFEELFLGESEFAFPQQMEALAEALIEAKLEVTLCLETHPLMFTRPELTQRLVDAGVRRFTMGAESGADSALSRIGRAGTREQILAGVDAITAAGGLVLTSWICNLPGETEQELEQTLSAMREVVARGGQVYWTESLMPLPGSLVASEPQTFGITPLVSSLEDWQRWSLLAKVYVTREQALAEPRAYLTHLDRAIDPRRMIERLYQTRDLARELVPQMKDNANRALAGFEYLLESEHETLDWYEQVGYSLLTF